jgi:hypothetical protein
MWREAITCMSVWHSPRMTNMGTVHRMPAKNWMICAVVMSDLPAGTRHSPVTVRRRRRQADGFRCTSTLPRRYPTAGVGVAL